MPPTQKRIFLVTSASQAIPVNTVATAGSRASRQMVRPSGFMKRLERQARWDRLVAVAVAAAAVVYSLSRARTTLEEQAAQVATAAVLAQEARVGNLVVHPSRLSCSTVLLLNSELPTLSQGMVVKVETEVLEATVGAVVRVDKAPRPSST